MKNLGYLFLATLFMACAGSPSSKDTSKQHGFPSELLGIWLYEYENPERFLIEQVYIFNSDGNGTVETRRYSNINISNQIIRFLRPEDVSFYYLSPSPQIGKVNLKTEDASGQISYKINNNYLVVSGINYTLFDQSKAKYRKLSDKEVEKWVNAKGKVFSDDYQIIN